MCDPGHFSWCALQFYYEAKPARLTKTHHGAGLHAPRSRQRATQDEQDHTSDVTQDTSHTYAQRDGDIVLIFGSLFFVPCGE